ncbi:MAG: peptidoglycan recognition protein family protein [Planctomycetota bacterium]|jgi:N-acetyl-anhydromuramyl-L-alanine amidase AmpD
MDKAIKLKAFIRAFIRLSCLFVLSGCIYNDEPMPKIVYEPAPDNKVTSPPTRIQKNVNRNIPRSWLPPSRVERKWTAIVIHHSDTTNGSATIFDKYHKETKYWEGVGYDFVIGNGTNSSDGQVEVTFRWRQQQTGAHCKTPDNWANRNAVGICLVGNFNQTLPTARQMQSLAKLVRFLQDRYRIPKSRIYGHNTTPGAGKTDCPGKKFPMAWLKSMLDS